MPRVRVACITLIMLALCGTSVGGEVVGKVDFLTRRGQRPDKAETLVWLESARQIRTPELGQFRIRTQRKTLIPHVIAIPVGSTVNFPNEDPISHNLFSLSFRNEFDLGFYRRGAGKSETFTSPGIVNVYCNVHPEMSAVIHVMPTPYYVFTDNEGNFSISNVEPGEYRISAWNEVGGLSSEGIVVPRGGGLQGVSVTIDGRNHRAAQHLDKNGKPYKKSRQKDY